MLIATTRCQNTAPLAVQTAIADVINHEHFPQLVEVAKEGSPAVGARKLLDKFDQVLVACYHKRADRDSISTACNGFIECFVDDAPIESEWIFVEPAVVIENC